MFRVQSISLECVNRIHVDDLSQFFVIHAFDFLDFVRCTETIEEVQERNTAFDCGQVSYAAQVHNFLYGVGNQHCETCLTACHNVGMVTEDGQSMCSQSTCCYVEYARQQFAGDFVHVRDHQQQTLRCCICCCQCTSCQGTVYCTCSTSFGLHFYNFYFLTKQVLFTVCCPVVCFFSHGRGRCDGEDTSYFCKRVGSICSSFVTIHSFHNFSHNFSPPFVNREFFICGDIPRICHRNDSEFSFQCLEIFLSNLLSDNNLYLFPIRNREFYLLIIQAIENLFNNIL